jgi:hypothetical protein
LKIYTSSIPLHGFKIYTSSIHLHGFKIATQSVWFKPLNMFTLHNVLLT